VSHFEHFSVERLWMTLDQIGDFLGVADSSDNEIAAFKKLLGELATEAAADPGNKPCALLHNVFRNR
jgi:hypothetical protein